MVTYDATTESVTVRVRPVYLDAKSDPIAGRFVFAYFVSITNESELDVQLLRRRWIIRDGRGHVQEVEGEGVVGRQPMLRPGETHEYHSFSVLPTFTGAMEGDYLLQREDGARFRAIIPRFYLTARTN
ncbi:MAG: Co2+/Mg2+ efflux protein ApaG [Bacteroidota bacterium]